MPSCRVTNKTGQQLNICLKQVTALHFENEVKPDEEIKFRPGKVWFTLEAQVDDATKATRYSVTKSAATIALMSVAVGAVAVTAGAAMLPAAATAGAAGGAAAAASYLSKASFATKAVLTKNAGTIAKISSVALPKAVEKLSAEVGGLSALQKEVVSIISSPTLSSDVRHKATDLLHNLHNAYSQDKAGAGEAQGALDETEGAAKKSKWNVFSRSVPASQSATVSDPAPVPAYPHAMPDGLPPSNEAEVMIEHVPISSGHILRVHGIHMDRRRRFEIHVNQHGKLELWDAAAGHIWSRTKEKEQDELAKVEQKDKEKAEKQAKKCIKSKGKIAPSVVQSDGEATSATDEELPLHPDRTSPHREGSVTSVELDRLDAETATVTESGLRRRGTVKDRLTALVSPAPIEHVSQPQMAAGQPPMQ